MQTFTNDDIYGVIDKNLGSEAKEEVTSSKFDFLPFPDLDAEVKKDVEYLKESKLVPKAIEISGWVYDVKTGKVYKVD